VRLTAELAGAELCTPQMRVAQCCWGTRNALVISASPQKHWLAPQSFVTSTAHTQSARRRVGGQPRAQPLARAPLRLLPQPSHHRAAGSRCTALRRPPQRRRPLGAAAARCSQNLAAQHGSAARKVSKETARLNELNDEMRKNSDRLDTLFQLAADEAAAGKPATPGSHQARRDAAWAYSRRLVRESNAIFARLIAKGEGRSLPMPDPTPPLDLPPPPEPDAAPASAAGEQPATPIGSTSTPTVQQGGSSSSEEDAHAGVSGAECSDAVPLLAAGSGRPSAGLRRRQGRQDSS
jgi:hypothetical protein